MDTVNHIKLVRHDGCGRSHGWCDIGHGSLSDIKLNRSPCSCATLGSFPRLHTSVPKDICGRSREDAEAEQRIGGNSFELGGLANNQRIERTSAAAVLRALLLSIFFQRTLENVVPETLDVFDTHVAVVSGAATGTSTALAGPGQKVTEIEREIHDKVEGFVRTFVETGKEGGEIAVVFLQRKNRKGWFAVTEALVPWEEHLISVHFVTRATTTRNTLNSALMQTLTFCSERRANVPALVGSPHDDGNGWMVWGAVFWPKTTMDWRRPPPIFRPSPTSLPLQIRVSSANRQEQNNLSYQILLSPPPPSELFPPSPPSGPQRLTSPPPQPSLTVSPSTAVADKSEVGYLGQAKDILALGLGVVRKGEF
ncbi:hypothetical protein A1Q1_03655 [Trichosporon asahii var. asahii CBS 2479]|uniref:Autophagy-related protein 101 n=1 Tax=Trichosporon asahii var. asahii (strain ATCC 90039 / CBS 2479 / JCM 2466 / KCTC 7840 / NBRC 103889/ NCYC 2677 / UAMH 7654) TaxID=1186058 RepID=J5RGL8_TRIAS|nr:hypothetical protein A1Q1_03655 [Trichosporon asahii var. asahii CBS 2479]EJT52523.1 hypothetical protein A1Q1_03655 [Trichosporon asahii var. asahii CBS 2479]